MFARPVAGVALLVAVCCGAPVARAEPAAPADFVVLQDVDPTIEAGIRYYTPHNFTGDRVDGYQTPLYILTARRPRGYAGPSSS